MESKLNLFQQFGIIDNIQLPNGGKIYFDKKSYESYKYLSKNFDKENNYWVLSIEFRSE